MFLLSTISFSIFDFKRHSVNFSTVPFIFATHCFDSAEVLEDLKWFQMYRLFVCILLHGLDCNCDG